jgi:hypothetical protein
MKLGYLEVRFRKRRNSRPLSPPRCGGHCHQTGLCFTTPHRITHDCSVTSAGKLGRTWTPSRSIRISASRMVTSSTPLAHWHQPTCPRHHLILLSSHPGQRHQPRHELQGPKRGCLHRHDYWKEALSRISTCMGCNARTNFSYTSVGAAVAGRQGA